MKLRKGFIVGMVSLLGVTAIAGCKKKEENVTLTKVTINGVQRTYEEGDTINWGSLSVTATYSDATSTTFTKFEYDVNSVVSSETQAVIYTSGLHAQTTVEDGVYAISVAFPSDLSTKYQAGNIAVGNATPDSYALVECSDPTLKTGYAANIRGAGTEIEPERNDKEAGKANENKFISSKTQYVVGTMNPFIYEPDVAFENLDDPTADLISGDDIHFRKDFEVRVKTGGTYVDASTSDYSVVNGNIQFKDSAIGKTFSLTVKLHDFDVVEGTTKKAESTFEGFTVQKGLNIYNAKQLGILNISKMTTAQLNEKYFVEHHNDPDEMIWENGTYVKAVYNEMWAEYLLSTGTFTAAELQAYADTPAIFLQRKLELKPTDLPSQYFVKPGELEGDRIVGCVRDGMNFYLPVVDQTDVEINGNFWTLDTTAIPLCKNDRSHNGPKEYRPGQVIMPGHTSLIEFCGIEMSKDDFKAQTLKSTGTGIIRNLNTIGNTGTDLIIEEGDDETIEFNKMLTLTGLIFVKNDYCKGIYENCIIKQYQIGVFADNMTGQAYGGAEQKDGTFIKETRMYDCANSGVFNYHNGGANVSKSVFNRFGATPLMNAGSDEEWYAANTNVTPDVVFNNEVTGEEIYFSALGANSAVGTIKGFNPLFEALGNQFLYTIKDKNNEDVQVMNLVAIGINGDNYLAADTPNYYSNFALNSGAENELKASLKGDTTQWQVYSNLHDAIYNAKLQEEWGKVVQAHDAAYEAYYNANFQSSWNEVVQTHDAQYQQAYNDNYASQWAKATAAHQAGELLAKRTLAKNALAQQYGGAPEDYTDDQADAFIASYPGFDDLFESMGRATFEAEFEAQAGFAYNEAAFLAYFNAEFEKVFEALAGFAYNEEAFLAYFNAEFDKGFSAALEADRGFKYDIEDFKAKAFNAGFDAEYQQPPVFQTEVASELFWTDLTSLYTASYTEFSAQLNGNYLHLIAPVEDTCLSLIFRISKMPAPALA